MSSTKNAHQINPYAVRGDLSLFSETTKENNKALSPSPTNKGSLLKSKTSLNKSTVETIKNGMMTDQNSKSTGNLQTLSTVGVDNESLRA